MVQKKLIGERVSLASITANDILKWYEWLNDLSVAIPLGSEAYTPVTIEGLRKEYDSMIEKESNAFSIVENESELSIGRCIILDINHINRSAKLEIFIGDKEFWNKGYGKEALTLLLDYAFNLINLNSIVLLVFSFNQRAINCYKSVGFKEIGKRRQARLISGKYYDLLEMDMVASEFEGKIVQNYL